MAGFGATLRPVANQLIKLFGDGGVVTCRRYSQSGSVAKGKKTRTLAETVSNVGAVVVSENIFEIDGWQVGDEVVLLTADGFTGQQLDGSWTIQKPGGLERPVNGPISPVEPGADVVYFQALIKSGASGGR